MVVKLALGSRLAMLCLIALSRAISTPYDTSARLNPPCLLNPHPPSSSTLLEGTIVWDGVYYSRIAECGYEYEQAHAFLPLLPLAMRLVATTVLYRLIGIVGYRATLAVAGIIINNVAFVLAACCFHRLSLQVLRDAKLAVRATALFCFNPASVFYSSLYSESLFCLLSFAGLWHLGAGRKWRAVLLLGLSSAVRSNGVLHAGFFLYDALQELPNKTLSCLAWVRLGLVTALQAFCTIAPFAAFQAYGFYQMCGSDAKARDWCRARIPYAYGFVQSHYWNVGFLRYFHWKQLPNFLLASPMLLLAASCVVHYAVFEKRLFFSLGLLRTKSGDGAANGGFLSPPVLCFVYQLAVMSCVVTLVMHVQVATRFLSVSPPLYWFAAHAMSGSGAAVRKRGLWLVFVAYCGVGSLLFSNFYPFT